VLILIAASANYPATPSQPQERVNLTRTLAIARSPFALGFSALIMLYVAVEVAIYVWMPTYLGHIAVPATAWHPMP